VGADLCRALVDGAPPARAGAAGPHADHGRAAAGGLRLSGRKLLLAIIEKFDGGPVGVDSLAAAISEERDTIEDMIEPFLIQQGFMKRTARGRMATSSAWLHFGLRPPAHGAVAEADLFSDQD
jgi:holliday junction DNA helicase RuvB